MLVYGNIDDIISHFLSFFKKNFILLKIYCRILKTKTFINIYLLVVTMNVDMIIAEYVQTHLPPDGPLVSVAKGFVAYKPEQHVLDGARFLFLHRTYIDSGNTIQRMNDALSELKEYFKNNAVHHVQLYLGDSVTILKKGVETHYKPVSRFRRNKIRQLL